MKKTTKKSAIIIVSVMLSLVAVGCGGMEPFDEELTLDQIEGNAGQPEQAQWEGVDETEQATLEEPMLSDGLDQVEQADMDQEPRIAEGLDDEAIDDSPRAKLSDDEDPYRIYDR